MNNLANVPPGFSLKQALLFREQEGCDTYYTSMKGLLFVNRGNVTEMPQVFAQEMTFPFREQGECDVASTGTWHLIGN